MSAAPQKQRGGLGEYGATGWEGDEGGVGEDVATAATTKGASALLGLFAQPPSSVSGPLAPPRAQEWAGAAPGGTPTPDFVSTDNGDPQNDQAEPETRSEGRSLSEVDPLLAATVRTRTAESGDLPRFLEVDDAGGTATCGWLGGSRKRRRWSVGMLGGLEGMLQGATQRLRSFGCRAPPKAGRSPSASAPAPLSPLGLVVGSTTSALYHCVFSLAMGSAITRLHPPPSARSSLLGPVTKMTALGVIFAGPIQLAVLGDETPALYPSADLFLAPFLSQMGRTVDMTLHLKRREGLYDEEEDDTAIFLATFAALAALGMAASSALCILAAKVKLANLGAFLPYAVICGFFSSIGVLVWTLAFSVDNSGAKIQHVLFRGGGDDVPTVWEALVHHAPSLIAGVAMKIFCPLHPALMPVFGTAIVLGAFAMLLVTGTSLDEAREEGWFWTSEELLGATSVQSSGGRWGPVAPFGIVPSLLRGTVDVDALRAGVPTVFAMGLIYTLRCSLHAVALRKLSEVLTKKKEKAAATSGDCGVTNSLRKQSSCDGNSNPLRPRSFSAASCDGWSSGTASTREVGAMRAAKKLNNLRTLLWYGVGHLISAIGGGFSALPAFAIGGTLFELGVEGAAPQYGGIVLLLYCYCSSFTPVVYIPKTLFSSLLVLGFLEFTWKWFVQSFFKTRNKWEWLVVPSIVIFAFVVPLLEAVVLGIAASTFIFVGSFYRSGIIKFASTALNVRSTVDRMDDEADILNRRGDEIQILVLHNFVFFGNSSSCMQYIRTMFEDPDMATTRIDFELPPVPRYIILDFSLVTGMDTSSVDVFAEVVALCKEEGCTLLFSGLCRDFRSILSCGGVKPISNALLFCADLDSAMGKAENGLLLQAYEPDRSNCGTFLTKAKGLSPKSGFHRALAQIESVQGLEIANLIGLEKYTTELTVPSGQYVCGSVDNPDMGLIPDRDRGLFFIENGSLKIERDPGCFYSLRQSSTNRKSHLSISALNARSPTVGQRHEWKKRLAASLPSRKFRLGNVGGGWVIGAVEACSKVRNPGIYSAVTECRLHHIPYRLLAQIEQDDPMLALNLFKLLAHVVSRRQMSVIEQLGNLHSIISSPPVTKPRGRLTMGAIRSALQ